MVVQQPAVLFGHSLGGHIAILVAARSPQLVRGLIIGDAPFDLAKLRAAIQRDQPRLLYWRELAGSLRSLEEMTEALKKMQITVA
jgi:pimeloyl-ACP methyl ester carboxylesterase